MQSANQHSPALLQTTTTTIRGMITVTASEDHRLPRRYGIGMERADESSFLDFPSKLMHVG